ncbi:type II toxin-antitoxin system RelE/ParE family toxin [Flavobacterium laiguense]|uniref:Plasmid stabilization system n=1 Tax=Flavobacterium laiguense TaxID=2169409 RepID=A0A2U1JZR5_9FLAO|nr:type II toxin-antitoxin system RelE/ParE family toxin [Flavobacterium laiguense]PWA10439.1 plasmid stabilization system [Flavobacterium laiguense]
MVFKLTILRLAEIEINESIDFYEGRSVGLGKYFLTYLKGYFKILKTHPELFEIKKTPYYRELPLKKFPFVIVYEIYQNEVIIHSVFHTSKNPTKKP